MKTISSNGIKIFAAASRDELIDYAIINHKILVAINAEKILHSSNESRLIINKNVGYPDGIGAVWVLRKNGFGDAKKIPGRELWLDVVKKHHSTKTFFLVGSKQEVIEETVVKLRQDYPGIQILNFRNGYIKSEKEKLDLIEDIKSSGTDIVFVAMGSPKQEALMQEIQKKHRATYLGLGGSFDVYIGKVKRAPKWWVANNLEWAYRLIKQPLRIRRQLHLIRFFVLLKLNKI